VIGVQDIWDSVQNLSKQMTDIAQKVAAIQKTLLDAARARSAEVVAVAGSAAAAATAKDSLLEALKFVRFWVGQYGQWKPQSQSFQGELSGFLDDVFQLPGQASRVLLNVPFKVPTDLAKQIVTQMPLPALYGLSLGLGTLPGWPTLGKQLVGAATSIPSIGDVSDESCGKVLANPDLYQAIQRADQLAAVLSATLELAIRHLPRDVSVNASVAGEGGGTEVAGHPAKVPLEWAKWAVELADKAFKKYLDFYSACQAAARAKEEAAWKQDVTDRLKRIEAVAAG